MRLPYPLAALLIGLVGFAGIEAGGVAAGVRTALGPSLWLDAAAYAFATLVLALLFRGALARARGARVLGPMLAFVLLFAPLTALLAGAADLTVSGGWGVDSLLRGAFIATPVNLVLTFTLELWFVALPLAVAALLLLRVAARAHRRR